MFQNKDMTNNTEYTHNKSALQSRVNCLMCYQGNNDDSVESLKQQSNWLKSVPATLVSKKQMCESQGGRSSV